MGEACSPAWWRYRGRQKCRAHYPACDVSNERGKAEREEVEPHWEWHSLGLKCEEDFGNGCFASVYKEEKGQKEARHYSTCDEHIELRAE